MEQRSRIIGYDYLRILAIFMVVMIHGSVTLLGGGNKNLQFVAMEINTLCLISVPCFFMISGALLLDDQNENPFSGFKQRLLKQGIPFVIWSFIYVAARILMKKIPLSWQAFTTLLSEPAYYQFWFMYSLLAIYLLLPILNSLLRKLSQRVLQYTLGLWLVFSVIQPTLEAFVPVARLAEHVDLILCEGYLGYFLLVYYLRQYGTSVRKRTALWMLAGGSLITMALSAVVYVFMGQKAAAVFYEGYLTPGVALAASGAFLLFQNSSLRFNKLVKTMSELSVGIFYLHMLVLTAFEFVGFKGERSLLICLAKVVATYGVSAVIAWVIAKIPVIRKLLLGIN